MAESKGELKSLMMKVKEESETVSLKLNIQKTKIVAFNPTTSWQIDEEKMETLRKFIFLGSKITVDGDCSHEIKRCLLLGKKAMTNVDSVLKSRDITLLTKVRLAKAMVFPVVVYRCESWTMKKAERRRMDWLDLLAVQGTLKSLLQHHSSKASILQCPGLGSYVQFSHPYMTTVKTIAWTIMNICWQSNVSAFITLSMFVITFFQRESIL